jgi:DNA modification methylase
MNRTRIISGDCIEGMKTLPDGCIHTCITSPPYFGLRNYNGGSQEIGCEESPEQYVKRMVDVFREVKRILRDDGTVWLNLGDSYASNGCYINAWLEKDHNKDKKHLHTKNHERYEDRKAFRGGEYGIKAKDLIGIPWRVAFALQADGWYLRQDIIWHKPNPMPESVEDRCTKAHEYIFMLSKKPRYYFDHDVIKESLADASIGRADRKRRLIEREGVGTLGKQIENGVDPKHGYAGLAMGRNGKTGYSEDGKRNKRSVWTVTTKPFRGAHFATFPKDLITPCVLAGCPINGTVFDPFTGSGTTAVVALNNNRNFIGTELNPEYVKLAERRIADEVIQTLEGIME